MNSHIHSGINERNKARRAAAGRAHISHPDGIRPRYPQSSLLPEPWGEIKRNKAAVTHKRYYIDLRHVAKKGRPRKTRDEGRMNPAGSVYNDRKQCHERHTVGGMNSTCDGVSGL